MGNIVISHHSSMRYWRHVGSSKSCKLAPCDENPLEDFTALPTSAQLCSLAFPGLRERPLHLLVPGRSATCTRGDVRTHVAPARLPSGSFYRIGAGLYVCSPEFTLVQLARFTTLPRLVEIASEMTSDYFVHPHTGELKERLRQITTVDGMRKFMADARCQGRRKAAEAVELGFDHARSPMEIKAALLMGLPRRLQGYAFPQFVLNFAVPIAGKEHLIEQDSFKVDIAYPNLKVGVEYLGGDSHPDLAADMRRINGLRALGWEILTLEKHQLYNPGVFHTFMLQLAEVMNERIAAMGGISGESGMGESKRGALEKGGCGCGFNSVHVPPAAEMLTAPYLALRAELGLS